MNQYFCCYCLGPCLNQLREKCTPCLCIPNSWLSLRKAVTHSLPSCKRTIRVHSNKFHPSLSFASCSTSFQLFQPRFFLSASTVLLPTKSSCKVSIKLFMLFFFSCSSVPVYFVWLKYISWFMYGFEALIINQWKDYGPICMYHFFPVRMSAIRVVVLIKKLHFVQMYLCNSFCHTMDFVWVSASSAASETSPRLPFHTSVSSVCQKKVASISTILSCRVYVPPREETSVRIAASFPEQRLVIEAKMKVDGLGV